LKRTFACGHSGKGQYCHTCAAIANEKQLELLARKMKRSAKLLAARQDPIDLSIVEHLVAVQREAREIIAKVSTGIHPYALKGKPLRSTAGQLMSVPVSLSYRLLFDAQSLRPLRIVSHEDYNTFVDRRAVA
jgi:hypothetical protein